MTEFNGIKRLSDEGVFDGKITENGNVFGIILDVSPERIYLTIKGDTNSERQFNDFSLKREKVVCLYGKNCHYRTAELYNLNLISSYNTRLSNDVSSFEVKYEVEYGIFNSPENHNEAKYNAINIYSKKINEWLGSTANKDKILRTAKELGIANTSVESELFVHIDKKGKFGINYSGSHEYSVNDLFQKYSFTPYIFFMLQSNLTADKMKQIYIDIYSLFVLLIGDDFEIDKVEFITNMREMHNSKSYLYFPSNIISKVNSNGILFPLGKDLIHETLNLPELPHSIFNTYFSMGDELKHRFSQFIKIKRIASNEERFLGYFRLAESLCFNELCYFEEDDFKNFINDLTIEFEEKYPKNKNVGKFIERLPNLNKQKHSVEKNIGDFYKTISKGTTVAWGVSNSNLSDLRKLRNDISHGNVYYKTPAEWRAYIKFLEVIVIMKLFQELGIDLKLTEKIINRVNGYVDIFELSQHPVFR